MIKSKIKKIIYKFFTKLGLTIYTKKQKRILNKTHYKNKSKNESVIFFTTHKCASNFSNELLKSVENISNYSLYDYGALIGSLADKLNINSNFEPYLNKNYSHLFMPYGEIYGPQRMPLNFPGLERFKKIFFLRDPRDMLVSAYYSFGFNHIIPDSKNLSYEFNKKRNKIQYLTIDEYVLEESINWVIPVFDQYKEIKENSKKLLFLKYDNYTKNTKEFIENIFEFIEVENELEINRLVSISNPVQSKIQVSQHKRSGKNNQWKTELQKTTQKKLTDNLKDILKYWEFID